MKPAPLLASRRRLLAALIASPCALVASTAGAGNSTAPLPVGPAPGNGDEWPHADPAQAGMDAAALGEVLEGVRQGPANVHALLVERGGRLVAELYRSGRDRSIWSLMAHEVDFGAADRHDMRSVSKSVVGLLFGIVHGAGKVGALDAPVLDFYPQYLDLQGSARRAITLQHLLTMSSGLEWHEALATYGGFANDETRLYWDTSPCRYVLNREPVEPPGTRFNYSGGATTVLADIACRADGRPLRTLAREALFEPLGIRDWEWVGDPYGRPLAFAGLRLRPRDLAKIGRLVLGRGQWQGRTIVPADWIAQSLQPRIPAAEGLRYGFHWWTGQTSAQGRRFDWAAAFGNGGQRLFVVPELDLSVVVTAGDYNDACIGREVNRLFSRIVATVQAGSPQAAAARPGIT